MICPHDGTEMDHVSRHGVEIDHCPSCGGIWLDRGELDHLIEAVRPAVELANPDPTPPPPPPPSRPIATEAPTRGAAYKPKKKKKAERFEDRDERSRPGDGKRYGGRHSRKKKLTDILEEIFDFD